MLGGFCYWRSGLTLSLPRWEAHPIVLSGRRLEIPLEVCVVHSRRDLIFIDVAREDPPCRVWKLGE